MFKMWVKYGLENAKACTFAFACCCGRGAGLLFGAPFGGGFHHAREAFRGGVVLHIHERPRPWRQRESGTGARGHGLCVLPSTARRFASGLGPGGGNPSLGPSEGDRRRLILMHSCIAHYVRYTCTASCNL